MRKSMVNPDAVSQQSQRKTEDVLTAVAREIRERLPVLRSSLPLNHAGISPQPRGDLVSECLRLRSERTPGEVLERYAGTRSEVVRDYARFLSVAPEEIAVTRHTAEGVNIVAQGFPWKSGDVIVTVNTEYPSNVYPWWNLRDRGVEIVSVPEREGRVDPDEFSSALTDRTRLVAISHVEFSSGYRFDLQWLSALCREKGIFLFLDIAQSIGVCPVDLSLVDAAAWPTWKWLMGPLGMGGFFLARRRWKEIRPVFVGTDGMVRGKDYLDYRFEFLEGAERFEYSTGNLLGMLGTAEALRRFRRVFSVPSGMEKLFARVRGLAERIIGGMEAKGYRLFSSRRSGETSGILSFEGGKPAEVVRRLGESGIEVAFRAGRIRIAPHFYNTEEDVERLLRELPAV
ncbi:MAG: aminotransferase class V-fold PLP-dependent enzyme [Candidatus Hydrogenedentota bacterium]|nr:MAG: aminotransferase class V-fold PLP-dependent enzyme [Candidatus Hydrogenedentota bacterium]